MIYRCIPEKVERIWGSLDPLRAGGDPVGEIWWFHPGTELEATHGERVKASSFFRCEPFPVILKTLHASRDLSVQVHPGRDRKPPMKDESWAILEGSGRILHGIREGTSREAFEDAVRNGTVVSMLNTLNASPGDLIHLPAGTVHALGGGLTVLEIQLNCTVTYRLWDYGRRDSAGNTRELHVEQGLDAVDWARWGRAYKVTGCVAAEGYSMERTAPGRTELRPMELLYDTGSGTCFFAEGDGGEMKAMGASWKIRIGK